MIFSRSSKERTRKYRASLNQDDLTEITVTAPASVAAEFQAIEEAIRLGRDLIPLGVRRISKGHAYRPSK